MLKSAKTELNFSQHLLICFSKSWRHNKEVITQGSKDKITFFVSTIRVIFTDILKNTEWKCDSETVLDLWCHK